MFKDQFTEFNEREIFKQGQDVNLIFWRDFFHDITHDFRLIPLPQLTLAASAGVKGCLFCFLLCF